jgi:hypothetical protein
MSHSQKTAWSLLVMLQGRIVVWPKVGRGKAYYGRAFSGKEVAALGAVCLFVGVAAKHIYTKMKNTEKQEDDV